MDELPVSGDRTCTSAFVSPDETTSANGAILSIDNGATTGRLHWPAHRAS